MRFLFLLACILSSPVLATAQLPQPEHVVVIIMENHAYAQIMGSDKAPHINDWARNANTAVFTNFHAVMHPSQPNYIALFSGDCQDVTDDSPPQKQPFTTPNLGAELIAVAKTFATFSESMPSVGFNGGRNPTRNGTYARKHNPCANWISNDASLPYHLSADVNQPFTNFPFSKLSQLPTVSFVVPNLDHDMHDGSIADGDKWLFANLQPLFSWALHNNTLVILTFDEDDSYHGNNIPVIFYGPMVKKGNYNDFFDHYNLLRTLEDMYHTGHAGRAQKVKPILNCWK